MLLPQDFASTMDVYMLTNNKPLAIAIDANKKMCFISVLFFYAKKVEQELPKLYLTDIFIHMAFYKAFIPFVLSGSHVRKGLKRFNEMRLVGKLALICNGCKRQIGVMD